MRTNRESGFEEVKKKVKDIPPIRSAQKSYEEHFAAAKENMDESEDSFRAVLDLGQGLKEALSGEMPDFEGAIEDTADGEVEQPLVILGPIKTRDSATRKVFDKYNGDFSRLTDVVRGTVVVSRYEEIGPAVAALQKEAEDAGWTVENGSAENKFITPTPAGYRDVSLLLRAPNGQVAEMQVNTAAMWHAKETKGHHMYEEWRKIAQKPGGPANAEERARAAELERQQAELYSSAWQKVLSVSA